MIQVEAADCICRVKVANVNPTLNTHTKEKLFNRRPFTIPRTPFSVQDWKVKPKTWLVEGRFIPTGC